MKSPRPQTPGCAVLYDFVHGSGFAAGATDALPNMLQVTDMTNCKCCGAAKATSKRWRKVKATRTRPSWTHGFLHPQAATTYIQRWAQNLPPSRRGKGTLIVQLREGVHGFRLSLGHTTETIDEYANAGPETRPEGFPAGV